MITSSHLVSQFTNLAFLHYSSTKIPSVGNNWNSHTLSFADCDWKFETWTMHCDESIIFLEKNCLLRSKKKDNAKKQVAAIIQGRFKNNCGTVQGVRILWTNGKLVGCNACEKRHLGPNCMPTLSQNMWCWDLKQFRKGNHSKETLVNNNLRQHLFHKIAHTTWQKHCNTHHCDFQSSSHLLPCLLDVDKIH